MSKQLTDTTRTVLRSFVAAAVGTVVSWATMKWGDLKAGQFAFLTPAVSTAYFGLVHWLEKKYPKLGWLLGCLPDKKVTAPTPAPVITTKDVKKTATKNK